MATFAQTPLRCQLCDGTGKIRFKCHDCDALLCETCLKVHSRIKTQATHKIVDLKDISLPVIEFNTLKTYKRDTGVRGFCVNSDKSIWLSSGRCGKILQRVQLEEDIRVLETINGYCIFGLTCLPSGGVLVGLANSKRVNLLNPDRSKGIFCDLTPQKVMDVHVTKTEEVVVLSIEEHEKVNLYNPLESSRRMVHILTTAGVEVNTIERDEKQNRLFTVPGRVSSSESGDLYIIDELGETSSRILAFDRNKKVQWIFKGNTDINTMFYAMDLTVTPRGNIISADPYNQLLYILNSDGGLIGCQHTGSLRIMNPTSLAILSSDELLIAGMAVAKGEKEKIHIVKFTNC